MYSNQSLFVVIVGCGRLGSYLANKLSRDGHSVVIIDSDESSFGNLSVEYSGFQVEGDATEIPILKQAKIDEANLVITTTREDNVNLMVAQIAKKFFSVPRVIARVFDLKREEIYQNFGIETICPTSIAGEVLLASLAESSCAKEKESEQ